MNNIIEEYIYKDKPAFKGITKCPYCPKEFHLDTTDKTRFDKAMCFECFMNGKKIVK